MWWPPSHRPTDAAEIRLEAELGGRFYARTSSGDVHLGDVLMCEPPDRIRYTWMPGRGTGPTEVEISFVADGEATLVKVVHESADSGLAEQWDTRVKRFSQAWDEVLKEYERFVQNGE